MDQIEIPEKAERAIRLVGIIAGAVVLSMAIGGGAVWWWMRNHIEADRQAVIIREIERTNTVIMDRVKVVEKSNTALSKQYTNLNLSLGALDEIKNSSLDDAIRIYLGR